MADDCCSGEQNESLACSLARSVTPADGWRSIRNLRASNIGRKNGAADSGVLSAWPEIQRYRQLQAGVSSGGSHGRGYSASRFVTATRNRGFDFSDGSIS